MGKPTEVPTMPLPAPIRTVEEFYAHAIAIEREAEERYTEFTQWFDRRGQHVLAGLCRNLATLEGEHHRDLVEGCAHLKLPVVAAGDYQWLQGASPESVAREFMQQVAKPLDLLEIALQAEMRARDYFVWIARSALSDEVRELAAVMAAEELQHVRWVREALDYHRATV
jgi:rubrerythrin